MKMYQATVPHILEAQQKVQIRGILMDDAKEFSINFVNEPTDKLQNITYHFKLLLDEQIIVQNYKQNGQWINHTETDGNIMNGQDFAFEFLFEDDKVLVYVIFDSDYTQLCAQFELNNALADIQKIEVWGDVQKVTQLAFSYP